MPNARFALFFPLMLGLASCGSKPKVQVLPPNPTPAVAGPALTGNQGIVQLNRPKGWMDKLTKEDPFNLKMTNASGDAYLTLQTRAKRNLPKLDLDEFAQLGQEAGGRTLKAVKLTGPTAVTRVNGYPARQYKLQGEVDGVETVLLYTAVESNDYFHQILAGSSRFGFERQQKTFQKIIQTFQEASETASNQ